MLAATATVVILAVTANGFPVNHVSANDGGVWLTNDNPGSQFRGTFAEFNDPIKQLGYNFGAPGASLQSSYDLDVLQQGTTVLAIDRNLGELYPVDSQAGAADLTGAVKFPINSKVAMNDGVAAILEPATAGKAPRLWATYVGGGSLPTLSGLNSGSVKPDLSIARGESVTVDSSGNVYVASRTEMMWLPSVNGSFHPPRTVKFRNALSSVALTTVGTTPVILDSAHRTVFFPLTGQSSVIPAPSGANVAGSAMQLQQSGPADGYVLVATETGLWSVPLSGQSATSIASVPSGRPAAPVRLDGCAYGAWSSTPAQAAQVCESGNVNVEGPLQGASGQPVILDRPVFRVNHNEIVLSDAANGSAWTVQGRPSQVLTDQDWIRVEVGSIPSSSSNHDSSTVTPDEQKRQPKLVNPTLHARPGQDTILHVLDQDSDPGGSILSVIGLSPTSGPGFSLRISRDTQSVVLTMQLGQTSPVNFSYTVVDGFGEEATGPVIVTPVKSESPPSPPVKSLPVRPVVSGGTVNVQVLGDWRDNENDALSLNDASVSPGTGLVTWTSDGLITFNAASVAQDTQTTITYHVTDGRSTPVTGQFQLKILGRADTTAYPPTGTPDSLMVLVGHPTAFSPLTNDIFGADPNDRGATLTLAGPVNSTPGLTVSTNIQSGEITVTAAHAGPLQITYQAAFGSAIATSTTQILVDAVNPAGTVQPPVTSPQSLLLHGQYPATIDVLADDYDPAGGLLSVVSVNAPPGLQATVVDGEYLRIGAVTSSTSTSAPLSVTYQVSNGLTSPVTGDVSILEEPSSLPLAPVVPSTFATVRAGDEVDIPVLASANDPDGESVHLLVGGTSEATGEPPTSVVVTQTDGGSAYSSGLGSASVSGGFLRYAAPAGTGIKSPESITASFVVESESGVRTTGETYLTVIPDETSDTSRPEPTEVDARVTAGATVVIPIPTTGIDQDGDSTALTGITSAPTLGRILSYNSTSITYQAFPFAAGSGAFSGGTDNFNYQVEGPTGLTAQATIRVSVTPPAQAQPPVAVDHFVTASPKQTVSVNLLSGDYFTAGDHVSVSSLSKTNSPVPPGASLVGPDGSMLQAETPSGADTKSIAFGISDGTAAPSVAHVLIRSEKGFVIPPVAADYFPSAPAQTASAVRVDVLSRDSDPDGRPGDLVVEPSPASGVKVFGKTLSIPVGPNPKAVPYTIRSNSTGATAVGVVHVLGTDGGPQLKPNQLIHVPRNGSVSINIGTYITEVGHSVQLTTNDEVSSSPTSGLGKKVTGNTGITLTGENGYVGPGSLTVQVIDASSLSSAGAKTATFSIPVVVGSPTPVVRCPSAPVTVVQGGPEVDLSVDNVCQVWTPDGTNAASVVFTEKWADAVPGVNLGWQSGENGHVVSLTAGSSAEGGSAGTIDIGVADGSAAAMSTLNVQVIATSPPIAVPANPEPVIAGQTRSVDMAEYVRSPLKNPNIYVTSISQASGETTPATISHPSVVNVTPGASVHGVLTYSVEVSDQGPNRPDRIVSDTITLQVLGAPGQPTVLQGVPGNGQVSLSWQPSVDNGSPVDYYLISDGQGIPRKSAANSYTWTGLTNGQSYTFTVVAHNQAGSGIKSDPASFTPHSVPDAPMGVTATSVGAEPNQATITWNPANSNSAKGSTVTYTVFVAPAIGGSPTMDAGSSTSLTWTGLSDDVGPYTFTVIAHNQDGNSPSSAKSNPVYAHGIPNTPPAPTASGQVSTDQSSTTVVVSWPAISDCNDAQPCAKYVVNELSNGSQVATSTNSTTCAGGVSLCASFGPITNNGASYTYTLVAINQENQPSIASGASSPPVEAVGAPSTITDLSVTPSDKSVKVTFTLPTSHGSAIAEVKYTAGSVSGAWSNPGISGQKASETITGLTNGTSYAVTVSACNESSKCGTPSSSASAIPYGKPQAPTATATQSGNSIVYAWSGGGNNGRSVANYEVCIDMACSSKGASPSFVTLPYACSTNHSVYAYVTDSENQQSGNSSTSMASTQTCQPPGPPTLSDQLNGNNVTYSWSGGGGSGLAISSYELCVDGVCTNEGANAGSTPMSYGCGQSHSAYAYVVDSIGQPSVHSNVVTANTPTCVNPSVTVSWGGKAPASICGNDASCSYLQISWANFPAGNHTIDANCASPCGGGTFPQRIGSGTSGSLFNYYAVGYCGHAYQVSATVDGTMSNVILTNQHSC
jgi:hypothetical protein